MSLIMVLGLGVALDCLLGLIPWRRARLERTGEGAGDPAAHGDASAPDPSGARDDDDLVGATPT
jgi:hypothetical protein